MTRIQSVLDVQARAITGQALQQVLVDLIDFSLVAKQAHWTVTGPRFRTLHRQLDEVVEAARRHADAVAERAATIGVAPDGRAATVSSSSRIPELPEGWANDRDVVAYFVGAFAKLIAGLRDYVSEIAYTDPVTHDLLVGITADMEKQYWMFQAEQD